MTSEQTVKTVQIEPSKAIEHVEITKTTKVVKSKVIKVVNPKPLKSSHLLKTRREPTKLMKLLLSGMKVETLD